jgi:hypothetical protein
MSQTVYLIYKNILKKDGSIADIRKFVDTWYREDMVKNLPVGAKWSELTMLWPEFAIAVFLRKYLVNNE